MCNSTGVVRSETADMPGPDASCPHLCIETARKKPIGRSQFVSIDLVSARLDVDDHELAFIIGSNTMIYVPVVNRVASASELLFAVPRF